MKKRILELLNKYYDLIAETWFEKLIDSFGNILTEAQIQTFVESSLETLLNIVKTSEYKNADQYLIETYTLFSGAGLTLLDVSQIYSYGRNVLFNNLQKEKPEGYDPVIILGFIDEMIEQFFARYGMLHQNTAMKELSNDRNRLADKLELSQKYLSNILHTSELAIMVIGSDEKFQAWNKSAERIFGYTDIEVIGKPSSLLLPEAQKYYEELDSIIDFTSKSSEVKIIDTERMTKEGKIIPVQLSIARLPGSNGEFTGRTVIIRDQSQVKNLQQQVDQSEKLAVIGQLAAGVAHEIGNPLTSISSLVQLIQRKNKDAVLSEQLIIIKENIDRISKIVRELVDFSRPPSYKKELVQTADILKTAVGIVKYDKRVKKVNFETEYNNDTPLIKAIPDQLLQVFVNILINALDAIEGTGTIKVKLDHNDEFVFIKIKDNGCGMDNKIIKKIFDPFFTTKEVGKGTGLGLSVSYGIVKNFNGDILVESKLNEGSTFTIKLPLNKN